MSTPNRFDRFDGEEIIFMYISMDTFLQAKYNELLSKHNDDHNKFPKEDADRIERCKHLISELIEFGQQQGSIPKKKGD